MSSPEEESFRKERMEFAEQSATTAFNDWRAQHKEASFREIPPELWRILIPKAVYENSLNIDNVELRPLVKDGGAVHFVTVEKDYPEELTNKEGWQRIQEFVQNRKSGDLPPKELLQVKVDPVHDANRTLIESGAVSLDDRILLTVDMSTIDDSDEVLRVANYDGLRGHGVGKEFYTRTLPAVAKSMKVRYIIGENSEENIGFFTDRENGLGRTTLDQIDPAVRRKIFPHIDNIDQNKYRLCTVQFLYDEDKKKYVI